MQTLGSLAPHPHTWGDCENSIVRIFIVSLGHTTALRSDQGGAFTARARFVEIIPLQLINASTCETPCVGVRVGARAIDRALL